MKHCPQGLPCHNELKIVVTQLDKDYDLFHGCGNKEKAIRDSCDMWKKMAKHLRDRADFDGDEKKPAPLSWKWMQNLVDDVVIFDVRLKGVRSRLILQWLCFWASLRKHVIKVLHGLPQALFILACVG